MRDNPDVETNYERAFAAAGRSDVLAAWAGLLGAIKSRMDVGRPIADE